MGGLSVANEDVVFFDGATTFGLAFDGSDVGLSSRRLDAFSWLDADTLLFSLDTDGATLPGITGTIDDSDLVRFDASSLGATTSGTFSLYFDGSDVGLTTNAEDVDAFELLANGQLLVSTEGAVGVTGRLRRRRGSARFHPRLRSARPQAVPSASTSTAPTSA